MRAHVITMEPRCKEPLCSEALGVTYDIFQPTYSVMHGKEPRYNEPISQSLSTWLNRGSTVVAKMNREELS